MFLCRSNIKKLKIFMREKKEEIRRFKENE